jgi:MSHA biogenesis protein MshK
MMIRNQRTEESKQRVDAAAPWRFIRVGVFCILSAVLFPVHAEDLPDPTRPPASIFAPAVKTGIGRKAVAKSSSGLRSIIISETRRAAIIDGQTVELGGQLGKAMLVEVNAGSVVLQRGKSRQVLTLFPGVKITHVEMADTGSAKMESSNNETQVEQPLPAIKVESDKHELKPVARDEKLLMEPLAVPLGSQTTATKRPVMSGHPKEEK